MGVEIRQQTDQTIEFVEDASAAVLMKAGGPSSPTVAQPRIDMDRNYKIPLTAGTDTGGGLLSFQNPHSYDLLIVYAMLDVTTASSGACTVSIGETGTNGTTLSSNLISGQTVAATGIFNSGAKSVIWPAGKWLTASTASGASAGLVANLYFCTVLR